MTLYIIFYTILFYTAHGENDIRSRERSETFKTLPCPDSVTTTCSYLERCNYVHPVKNISIVVFILSEICAFKVYYLYTSYNIH